MRRLAATALALACAATCGVTGAQALVVDTRTPRPEPAPAGHAAWSDEQRPIDAKDAQMPWVHGGPPGVAARINDALYLQTIEAVAPRAPGSTFTPAPPPHPSLGYAFCELHFSVERNDGRVLSIAMQLDWRGSGHCAADSREFHFDAATGRQLEAADLLTPAGRATLIQQSRQAAAANYDRLLAALPPDPEDQDADADADADAVAPSQPPPPPPSAPGDPSEDEQRRFFRSCRDAWQEPAADDALDFDLPAKGGLEVPSHGCAGNRHELLMDDPPGAFVVPDARLEPLLTPYGRRLLLGEGSAPAPAGLFGQTLRGRVGTTSITLHLGAPRGRRSDIDSVYAYDRIGTAITLYGSVRGDTLELREDADGSGFTLRQVGRALVGTWHGKGKTLPARLE